VKLAGDVVKLRVLRPQYRAGRQARGGEQVDVNVANATSEERRALDKTQDFSMLGHLGPREVRQCGQYNSALADLAQGEFAEDIRVRQNMSGVQELGEHGVVGAKMIDPDRRIDQYHARFDRRLGGA
jgi:hypothetical protein